MFLYLIFFFILFLNPALGESERDHADYWINVYNGALNKNYSKFTQIAYNVFNKVKYCADKSSKRIPSLIILSKGDGPWAMAINDGTVLISWEAINACLSIKDLAIGKSRLAFIFGHEMAHLAADDYWEENAIETANQVNNPEIEQRLISLFNPVNSPKENKDLHTKKINLAFIKKREIRADSFGLLYAYIAGFNPKAILEKNGSIFFSKWSSSPDKTHPSPELRASYLKTELQDLTKKIDLFRIGSRLYQLGKYDDALSFIMAFQKYFPSREVFNVLGLIFYQQAINSLLMYQPERVSRFYLSTILDAETRMTSYEIKRSDPTEFVDNIQKAIFNFKAAIQKDPMYLPAKVNLSSAYIMNKEYYNALAVLSKALEISNDNPEALNNEAIALYLQSPQLQVDLFQQALNKLKSIIQNKPDFSIVYYNIGRLMLERDRNVSAKEYFTSFLKHDSYGLYSKKASNLINKKYSINDSGQSCFHQIKSLCPIKLGRMNNQMRKKIKQLKLNKHDLPISTAIGEYYSGNGYLFLVLENVVELIEIDIPERKAILLSNIPDKCPPIRFYGGYPDVNKTFIYRNFAVDLKNQKLERIAYYGKNFFKDH